MDKVKLGFIGCGGITQAHLDHGLKDFPDVEFVGWCDLNLKVAELRQQQVDGQGAIYTVAEQMLDETKPDAVFIMLPPFAHGSIEDLVLERDLPFFIEKPVAIDLPTAQRVAQEVNERELITSVGYMNRYRDSSLRVHKLIQKSKPVMMHGGWVLAGPKEYEGIWKWWVQKDKSGGQFLEMTTHTIDLARHFFGEVSSVCAVAVNVMDRPDFFTIDDAMMVQLTFENGAAGNLYNAACTPVGESIGLTLWGTDLRADFETWDHDVRIQLPDGKVEEISGGQNIFAREDRAFIDSVKAGENRGILATYEDGLRATEIAVAATTSLETGEPIIL
ncbi:MAG: Gfo/Idh/MocA family oxidoreductase [Candidatus Omnitrophica bacterium]|nr:Gfo/Idh/MocA family oxidoreductase [Candidatus Omnitrophota bacterium]